MLPFNPAGIDFSRINALRSLYGGAPPMHVGNLPMPVSDPLRMPTDPTGAGSPLRFPYQGAPGTVAGAPGAGSAPPLWGAQPPIANIPGYGNFSNLAALQSLAPTNLRRPVGPVF